MRAVNDQPELVFRITAYFEDERRLNPDGISTPFVIQNSSIRDFIDDTGVDSCNLTSKL